MSIRKLQRATIISVFVYKNLGDYDKALEYYRKALKINIKLYGEEYSKVLAIKKKIEEVKAKKEEEK